MEMMKKSLIALTSTVMTLSVAAVPVFAEETDSVPLETESSEAVDETTKKTEEAPVVASESYAPGATVVADENSPSGYTVHFVYDGTGIDNSKTLESVSVTGPFQYVDPEKDLKDSSNAYTPDEYVNGMYATNCAPGPFSWGYTKELVKDPATGNYEASFPITSGSFAYSYSIKYAEESNAVVIDDPANPSPAKNNPYSISPTGDLTHSIVYGKWDAEKQSKSPDLDFVLEASENKGSQSYVSYKGSDGATQYLGIYLPDNYDSSRTEPYKVIYASHGGGGNETDWFAMGHADNIMDNLANQGKIKDTIVVTMDNSHYGWNFSEIEDNVLNYIIPFMEQNYNVSAGRDDRAFCGLSMGGMTTNNMLFDHPEEFGYFGIFSGTDMSAVKENGALGEPKVMIAVGTCDVASENVMPNSGGTEKKYEDLVRWNETNNLIDMYDAGYIKGAHDWFTWSQCFEDFAGNVVWSNEPSSNEAGVTVGENTDPGYKVPYQASFVYEDQSEKNAVSVKVTGNFQWYKPEEVKEFQGSGYNSAIPSYDAYQYEEGMFNSGYGLNGSAEYEMTQTRDERFELTLPLPGNLYCYDYKVTYSDGTTETVKDPANLPEANSNGHDAGHSLVYVGNAADTENGQEYIYPRTDGKAGTTKFVTYKAIDGTEQPLEVYLPHNYSVKKTYKTIYISHGGGGNEAEWMSIGAVSNIMDNLIAEGKTDPAIVVAMDNTYFGWDYDKVLPNVVDNIIPYIESMYNVSDKAEDRAFCGLSMGSMTTNQMAKKYPEIFRFFGSFSGGSNDLDKTHYNVKELNKDVLYLTAGCIDMAYNNTLGIASIDYIKMYDELGIKYNFELKNGAHDWGVWRASFTTFAKDYLWNVKKADDGKTDTKPVVKPNDSKKDNTTQTPQNKDKKASAKTGDTSNTLFYGGTLLVGLVAVVYALVFRRRHN